MAEEKFISIEYSVWNRKYKPMEERLNKLELELMQCKSDKEARVYINFGRGRYIDKDVCVGYMDMMVCPPSFVRGNKYTGEMELSSLIRDRMHELLEQNVFYKSHKVLNKEEAADYEKRIVAKIKELTAMIDRNDKLWARIKQMPKWIRYLFGVK
jgi:hypothetical protein